MKKLLLFAFSCMVAALGWAQSYMSYDIIYTIAIIFILMAFVLITILFIIQRHTMGWSKEVVQW